MTLYRHLLWPLLARLEPERAHGLTLSLLSSAQRVPFGPALAGRLAGARGPDLGFEWRGIRFAGPAGIAAGWDKDGRAARMAEALGAGFVEVGTVTPLPQPGNPGRRIFRLRSRDALVNRLGFPSLGAARVVENLSRHRPKRAPLGINVGKNASTPLDDAADDYAACLRALHDVADYFVVNVSSPNTPGLTSLQSPEALDGLLAALDEARRGPAGGPPKPLLVKLSADLSASEIEDAAAVCQRRAVDGAIAVNTSLDPALRSDEARELEGGLSGRPIFGRALDAVERLRAVVPPDFLIVGAGGVFGADDALRLLNAGADAVQVYTGLVYRGPGLLNEITRGLAEAGWSPRPDLK